jgi:hypothetical protein
MACSPPATSSSSTLATLSCSHSKKVDLPLPGAPTTTLRGERLTCSTATTPCSFLSSSGTASGLWPSPKPARAVDKFIKASASTAPPSSPAFLFGRTVRRGITNSSRRSTLRLVVIRTVPASTR